MPPLMHECSADGGGQAMVLKEEEGRSGGGGGPEVETNRTPANRCKAIHAGVRPMARLEHRFRCYTLVTAFTTTIIVTTRPNRQHAP